MMIFQIQCNDLEDFVATCAGLVREGICFEATTSNLVITPTGGF